MRIIQKQRGGGGGRVGSPGCCAGRRGRPPPQAVASSAAASSSSLLLAATTALLLLAAAGTLPTAAARSPPLPSTTTPSLRPHMPSSFAGSKAAISGSPSSSSTADHHHRAAAPLPPHSQMQPGRKWRTVLQQQQQHQHDDGSHLYALSSSPLLPTGALAQLLQQRQQRRQRDRVRDLLLRAVGGAGGGPGSATTQVLERPAVGADPAVAAEQPVSPEWFAPWVMDAAAEGSREAGAGVGVGTLLAPPSAPPAEGSPYEAFDYAESVEVAEGEGEGDDGPELEGLQYEGAALLMASYLGPVVTRPTPPPPVAAATGGIVAIRPRPAGAASVVVQRPPLAPSFAPATEWAAAVPTTTRRRQAGILARAVRWYTSLLDRHYHLVSFVQATLLGIMGDVIAQLIEAAVEARGVGGGGGMWAVLSRFRPNVVRTGNVAMLAAIIDGVVTPQYYDLMERVSPRKSLRVILLKLLVTLAVYGPVTNGAFLAAVPILEKGLGAFNPIVWAQQLKEITVKDVQLWSFFYPINFTLVPRTLRPLANNIMATTFLVILSVCAYGSWGPGAL